MDDLWCDNLDEANRFIRILRHNEAQQYHGKRFWMIAALVLFFLGIAFGHWDAQYGAAPGDRGAGNQTGAQESGAGRTDLMRDMAQVMAVRH